MDDRSDRLPVRPEFASDLSDRASIQIGADDPSLDADIVLVSGSDAKLVDVNRVVAQGRNARQTLARALDPDPASDGDAIPRAQFVCQPPAAGCEERMPA